MLRRRVVHARQRRALSHPLGPLLLREQFQEVIQGQRMERRRGFHRFILCQHLVALSWGVSHSRQADQRFAGQTRIACQDLRMRARDARGIDLSDPLTTSISWLADVSTPWPHVRAAPRGLRCAGRARHVLRLVTACARQVGHPRGPSDHGGLALHV